MTRLPVFLIACFMLAGCVGGPAREIVRIEAETDLNSLMTFYVEHRPSDERDLHVPIASSMVEMGYAATSGQKGGAPSKIDALVTYRDVWTWDLGWYPLELTLTLRKPETRYPIAVGTIVRGSIDRGTVESLTKEVMTNVLVKKKNLDVCHAFCGQLAPVK